MTILWIVALVIIGMLLFFAGMGYGISRSLSGEDYDWDDFDEEVDADDTSNEKR